MRKQRSETAGAPVRPIRKSKVTTYRYRRILLASVLAVLLLGTGLFGFLLGQGNTTTASESIAATAVAGMAEVLFEQENRCAAVEQINLQQELANAQKAADELANSLAQQQEELQRQQEEMESLEENILNALMVNLSEKTVSRTSPTVTSYAQKAKDLLSLSRKVRSFEKTPEAAEVDLTDYKAAIKKQLANIPTLKPIPGSLSGYGYRYHPIYGYRHFHPAVDMGAKTGTSIKAAGAGTVTGAGYNRSAGRYVKINHGNGFETVYYHCSKLNVQVGDRVSKGEVIATVGNTGTSTTPHLHFGITFYGSPVNPNQIIME
ncbi:MAG: M23 family metallopeptidase [Bacillota bacterium]|nr:M23 family metallopeptidase [Bacillota bacterium]